MITAAQIKFVRSLADKKPRRENNLFVAEGSKLINDLLDSTLRFQTIYALEGTIIHSSYVQTASQKDILRMSNLKTAPDAIALIEIPELSPLSLSGLTLMLDSVQDPGNIGTIIRIADWFGIKRIICSENCADCFSPKVIQATMGSISRVEVYYTALEDVLDKAIDLKIPAFGTFLEGQNIYSQNLPSDAIIVMGNEGRGISSSVAAKISNKLLIPAFEDDGNHCESLNVAVASSIICSEFRRATLSKL